MLLFQGVTVLLKGKEHMVYGVLIAFVGDTPAANKVGGFKEGVAMAERKCRHCNATNSLIQTKVNLYTYVVHAVLAFRIHCSILKKTLH